MVEHLSHAARRKQRYMRAGQRQRDSEVLGAEVSCLSERLLRLETLLLLSDFESIAKLDSFIASATAASTCPPPPGLTSTSQCEHFSICSNPDDEEPELDSSAGNICVLSEVEVAEKGCQADFSTLGAQVAALEDSWRLLESRIMNMEDRASTLAEGLIAPISDIINTKVGECWNMCQSQQSIIDRMTTNVEKNESNISRALDQIQDVMKCMKLPACSKKKEKK